MKTFKILRELPKCGTVTWSEQMLLESGADRAADAGLTQTFNL